MMILHVFGVNSKEKPGEPQSSEVNENPEGPKTDKVSSEVRILLVLEW
jgi:hypothetical protein